MNSKLIKPSEHLNAHYIPANDKNARFTFVWAHGWQHSHQSLVTIAKQLKGLGEHYVLDLPGHGETSKSCKDWSISKYVNEINDWLQNLNTEVIWIGHSLGCRVGNHLAAMEQSSIKALFLICPPFNLPKNLLTRVRILAYKTLCLLGVPKSWTMPIFASSDYQNADELRPLFLKFIQEDSSEPIKKINCPVQMISTTLDVDAPIACANRLMDFCPQAQLNILDYFDHLDVLTSGQHLIIHHLTEFSETLEI